MDPSRRQLYQPSVSARSSQPTLPATATGHPDHPNEQVHQIRFVNPAAINPPGAHTRPYLYSNHRFPIYVPPYSPSLSSSASTPSHIMATSSPMPSVQTSSTRHTSLQPPSIRTSSTRPPSNPIPLDDTRSVPRKRTRKHTPNPPTLHPTPPILPPSSRPFNHLPQLLSADPSSERPTKRPRLDAGHSSTAINPRGSERLALSHIPSRSNPKPKKVPLHPLAVDYSRPITLVVPRPPPRPLSLQKNSIPLPPSPEDLIPKRSLDDELRGPVDPAVSKELERLMWEQQNRVWKGRWGFPNPFPVPKLFSPPDTRSPGSYRGITPAPPWMETITLYGPPPRNNASVHLGEHLTNPKVVVLDDDEDGGFEEVLDLYRGAVQGSTLSMELEFAVGGDIGVIGPGWEDVGSLEVSVKRKSPTPSLSGEHQESRIRTLAGYKQVIQAEKTLPPLRPVSTKEEPPLGIEWSYSCCGYATGRAVNVHDKGIPQ